MENFQGEDLRKKLERLRDEIDIEIQYRIDTFSIYDPQDLAYCLGKINDILDSEK